MSIVGETVTVIWDDVEIDRDHLNNPVYGTREDDVENVIIAPGPRQDVVESTRPDGTLVSWTCHFPKTFIGSLRGAQVKVRDDEPRRVIGDPQPYTEANTPGEWNRPVELEGVDG